MVKIAVAGGTGNVAAEVLRAPIASGKHDFTIFTRSQPKDAQPGVAYKNVDYNDKPSLVAALKGFDVCLSFIIVTHDVEGTVQKNLIDACIEAGVKRFSPSEWGIKNESGIEPYMPKDKVAEYLASINKDKPVIEYCLFQPSIFMDYFAHPYPLSSNLHTWPFFIDFHERRAMVLDGGDQPIVVTAISDISQMLALALDDPKPWPAVGGMRGARTTINELLELGKKIRGGEWQIEYVKGEDIEKGELKTSWVPPMTHPAIPDERRETFSREFVIMFFLGILRGAWDVSDQWNERHPDFKFVGLEEYLTKAWKGKS